MDHTTGEGRGKRDAKAMKDASVVLVSEANDRPSSLGFKTPWVKKVEVLP
jgi:hypothetical protein